MTKDVLTAVFIVAFGCLLVVHCPRAALREYRSGVARGRSGDYPRQTMPIHFWATIIATAAAGLFGVSFVLFGIGMLLALGSTDL